MTILLDKTSSWFFFSVLCLTLTGCFDSKVKSPSSEKLPEWIVSPPKSNTHIYGVGSAARIENLALSFIQAEQNGNAQIAQQLRTQVSQTSSQDIQVSVQQGQESVSKIQTAYTQVTTSPIELEQASNEERFAAKNYVYALQSINRARIVQNIKAALQDIDVKIHSEAMQLSTSLNETPATSDWQRYMRLIPYFAQRKVYRDELALYSYDFQADNQTYKDIDKIEQQLEQALLIYGFDPSKTAQTSHLSSALSDYGFSVKNNGLFRLESTTKQHTETQSGRFYVFEEGSMTLIGPSDTTLASWNVSARGISSNQTKAEQAATKNWANQAVSAMFTWLTRLD